MLDFFERAYFAELDRKTKLQTALAFSFSTVVVGVTLLGYAIQNWPFKNCENVFALLPILGCGATFCLFVYHTANFSLGKNYKYIWTLNEMLRHQETLIEFSKQYPDAPSADETFKNQLMQDIAFCTSHNAQMNDVRSENLYYANASAMIFTLIALITAGTISLTPLIRG